MKKLSVICLLVVGIILSSDAGIIKTICLYRRNGKNSKKTRLDNLKHLKHKGNQGGLS